MRQDVTEEEEGPATLTFLAYLNAVPMYEVFYS